MGLEIEHGAADSSRSSVEEGKLFDRKNSIKYILATAEGRRFLYNLLEVCGVYRSSISESPNLTYRNEGRREVGLYILEEILLLDDRMATNFEFNMRREAFERECLLNELKGKEFKKQYDY